MNVKRVYTKMADSLNNPQHLLKWIASIALGTLLGFAWLSTTFMTTARGQVMMDRVIAEDQRLQDEISNLALEVKESNDLLRLHIERERLDKVIESIRQNESDQYNNQQFVLVNGENEQARNRARELITEREDLEMLKNCIITKNKICDS